MASNEIANIFFQVCIHVRYNSQVQIIKATSVTRNIFLCPSEVKGDI